MHEVEPVHRVDGEHHLGHVEAHHLLGQVVVVLAEQREQVASAVVVHYQVLHAHTHAHSYTRTLIHTVIHHLPPAHPNCFVNRSSCLFMFTRAQS